MFIQKVFNDWWTEEEGQTTVDGFYSLRPFKGEHLITVSKDGFTTEAPVTLSSNNSITVVLDFLDSTEEIQPSEFIMSPVPVVNNTVSVTFPEKYQQVDVIIYDMKGRKIQVYKQIGSGTQLEIAAPAGNYNMKFISQYGTVTKPLIIL